MFFRNMADSCWYTLYILYYLFIYGDTKLVYLKIQIFKLRNFYSKFHLLQFEYYLN